MRYSYLKDNFIVAYTGILQFLMNVPTVAFGDLRHRAANVALPKRRSLSIIVSEGKPGLSPI